MEQPQDNNLNHLLSLQESVKHVLNQVVLNFDNLQRHCQRQMQPWQLNLQKVIDSWSRPSLHQRGFHCHFKQNCVSALASLTMNRQGPQILCDLAMAKDDVKARLAPISVFTVANPKNEFVLVAGENNSQLGFFFFRKEDAESLVEKIREENPRLARDSKIVQVTMDNVYDIFTRPRQETGLTGVAFRFFPSMKQVGHALQLYKEAGVPTRQFVGVPVFQAEGLTVTAAETQYVPLFLYKEDLDVAVQSAHTQRNATQIRVQKDRVGKLQEEYQTLVKQLEEAPEKDKPVLEKKVSASRSRLDGAMEKVAAIQIAPLPKIEVGSFEEVISRMTTSAGNDLDAWKQVMFVSPGLLTDAQQVK